MGEPLDFHHIPLRLVRADPDCRMRLAVERHDHIGPAEVGGSMEFHASSLEIEREAAAIHDVVSPALPWTAQTCAAGAIPSGRGEIHVGIAVIDEFADFKRIHRHQRAAALGSGKRVAAAWQA